MSECMVVKLTKAFDASNLTAGEFVPKYFQIYVYMYMCTCMHIYMCVCVCVYVHFVFEPSCFWC